MASTDDADLWDAARQRFDPRAKALVYVLGSGLALLATGVTALLLFNVVTGALIVGHRLVRRWLSACALLLPTLLLFAVVSGLSDGLSAAAGAALRLLALTTAGVLFFATTPPEELGEALQASGLSPQTAFLLEGTLRFVPTMGALLREVRDAQASRGIRFDGLHLLRNGPALLAPLLVGALHFADTLAEALEGRGFGSPRRTLLRDYRFAAQDWALVAAMSILTIAIGTWQLAR